jgi:oxygen-dependent protoporphyrinogen oxidase
VPPIVERLDLNLAAELSNVAYRELDLVSLAWRQRDVPHPMEGTGWVRALGDSRATLACTWSSRKWPERAPARHVLVRSVVTGIRGDERGVVEAARDDLRDLLGVRAPPVLLRVRRLTRSTPIYEVGHAERINRVFGLAAEIGPIVLAGNAYGGIGLPDCIASGEQAARRVLARLGQPRNLPAPARGLSERPDAEERMAAPSDEPRDKQDRNRNGEDRSSSLP